MYWFDTFVIPIWLKKKTLVLRLRRVQSLGASAPHPYVSEFISLSYLLGDSSVLNCGRWERCGALPAGRASWGRGDPGAQVTFHGLPCMDGRVCKPYLLIWAFTEDKGHHIFNLVLIHIISLWGGLSRNNFHHHHSQFNRWGTAHQGAGDSHVKSQDRDWNPGLLALNSCALFLLLEIEIPKSYLNTGAGLSVGRWSRCLRHQ